MAVLTSMTKPKVLTESEAVLTRDGRITPASESQVRSMIRYWTYEGVGLLHGRYVKHRFVPHAHEEYSIAVITRGALMFEWAGKKYVAEPATISAINPGEIHTGQPGAECGWEYRHFFVPRSALIQFVPELAKGERDIQLPVIEDPETARALVRAHHAITQDAPALEKDARLTEALTHLFAKHSAPSIARGTAQSSRPSTRMAQDYLRAHFSERIRLATLASLVNLSPYHFLRTFAQDTGLTPHAYQEQLRVTYGFGRLKQGASAAEVADEAGYADQSHFIRALKKTYGLTPSLVQRVA